MKFETISQTFNRKRNKVASETVLERLKVCISTTSFQFCGEIQEVSDGLPIGSRASPAIANIFMSKLEEDYLQSSDGAPKVWFRYVDHVFLIFKKKFLEKLLAHLSNQHPSIIFTLEREEDGKLLFMDAHVHHIDRSLQLGIYRKPTNTGRYLVHSSHHLAALKDLLLHRFFEDWITLV